MRKLFTNCPSFAFACYYNRLTLLLFLILLTFNVNAQNNIGAGTYSQNVPDVGGAALRLFGALIFVIGLFLIGAYFFKNWKGFVVKEGRKSQLKIIEVKHIGNRQALFVIGHNKKRMLVGVTQTNINLICQLPDEDEDIKDEERPPFVSILNKITGAK